MAETDPTARKRRRWPPRARSLGTRQTRSTDTPAPAARLPHERDESADPQASDAPRPVMARAARDLQEGQVDTDARNTPPVDLGKR